MQVNKLRIFLAITLLMTVNFSFAQDTEGHWERLNLTGRDQWWYVVNNLAFKDAREYQEYVYKTQKPKTPHTVASQSASSPSTPPIVGGSQLQGVWFCKSTNQYVSKLADQKCPVPWIVK